MGTVNAFLNGCFLPAENAYLNIEDRGTLFGDGVYEFFRVYRGRIFQAEEHLSRLRYSAGELEIKVPYNNVEIVGIIEELISNTAMENGGIYLQLTRGDGPRMHYFPENCCPNFFIVAREILPVPAELYEQGVDAVLLPDERWKRCDIKSLNLLPNVLAKEKAKAYGVYDAILHSDLGVTESTSSSVLAVKDGVLLTTPPGPWILPGVTKNTVLKLAGELGIPVGERFMTTEELLSADEVMLTSTRIDILPVVEIDRKAVGSGRPGPVVFALRESFARLQNICASEKKGFCL
ncbi:MAG: D-amino-acid transaminase [Bacillota bacterium]|nr:D-amino-acid transaminase [Bacillota bacterium]MDW7685174.1 D-amino-acid transaminase [Bacillota bacterium]